MSHRAALISLLVLGLGCADEPEIPSGSVTIRLSSAEVVADGSKIEIMVSADDHGAPGSGEVALRASHGSFANDSGLIVLQLSGGSASTAYSCLQTKDAACNGTQTLRADWGYTIGYSTVEVLGEEVTDGGLPNGN